MTNSKQRMLAAIATILLFGLAACSKDPVSPDLPRTSQYAGMAAEQGTNVIQSLKTLDELNNAIAGPKAFGEMELPPIGSIAGSGSIITGRLQPLRKHAVELSQRANGLHKVSGDSLIYESWYTDPQTGVVYHVRIRYSATTGKAFLLAVATNFPAPNPAVRDSASILVDTNFTLEDSTDDVVERLDLRKDYRSGFRLRYEEGTLVPDAYLPGHEPTGGIIDAKKVFSAGQDSAEATYHLEYHEAAGGVFSVNVRFEDGTVYQANATFSTGRISFTANFRDGGSEQTEVTFIVEHELHFTKTLTFAPGSDPRSIFERGDFVLNPADSSAIVDFEREVFYASGSSERGTLHAEETRQNGFRRVELSGSNSDGSNFNLVLQESPGKTHIEGNAIDKEQRYVLFNAEVYPDGSGDLYLEVYANKAAFDNGEPAIFVADLHFGPDGSGSGSVTSNEGTETFRFGMNGSVKG